jgi:16S rRNA (uracil1498-N3)-methyltransferase
MTGQASDPDPTSPARQPARDHRLQRLFVSDALSPDAVVTCRPAQANYLMAVMRMGEGARVVLFNGRDGEWLATIASTARKSCNLRVIECLRAQTAGPDVDYLFAPLKHARLDYMVQKATELGVARLRPVITRRTIAERVNLDRMRANVIEAAEQCGVLWVPDVMEPLKLAAVLASWPVDRPLIVCDESAAAASPLGALTALRGRGVGVLIGPEGGFDPVERVALLAVPGVVPISLGPRIMRADTAAVAALALVNAVVGEGW